MRSRQEVERAYDSVPYADKEAANMPVRFYELNSAMVSFLEEFIDLLDNSDKSDNMEEMHLVKDLLEEVATSVDVVIGRLENNNAAQ